MKTRTSMSALLFVSLLAAGSGNLWALTIDQVQYCDAGTDWKSPYAGHIVDVTGGVVTYAAAPPGKRPRLVVQAPGLTEWAGIEVKLFGATLNVAPGDQIDLMHVYVDEGLKTRGTTYLLYSPADYGSSATLNSTGHTIDPLALDPAVLGAGPLSADPAVTERYEGMLLRVANVTVGTLNLGSHADNYELTSPAGTCWATDYLNVDRPVGQDYHPWTTPGRSYDTVVGILEQYLNDPQLPGGYNYYQLMSRSSADLVPEPLASVLLLGGLACLARRRCGRSLPPA